MDAFGIADLLRFDGEVLVFEMRGGVQNMLFNG